MSTYQEFCRLRDLHTPGANAPKHTEADAFFMAAAQLAVPAGYKLVPLEPTPEIIAGAAVAIWPTASAADIALARLAAPLVLMQMDMAPGTTADAFAGMLATMAPAYRAMLAAAPIPPAGTETFQSRVRPWMLATFGPEIPTDRDERNHRFLEESLELVQSCGCTASEAHQLVDYVFGRPVGERAQEVGGVMITLAALCLAQCLDMHAAGETELARIWTKVEAIRAKQEAKPKHSPLPAAAPQLAADEADLECQIPPHGWRCKRGVGHDGPCAAIECPEDVAAVKRGMARLAAAPVQAKEPNPHVSVLKKAVHIKDCLIATNEALIIALEDELFPFACEETRDAILASRRSRLEEDSAPVQPVATLPNKEKALRYPATMTAALTDVLGLPNFRTGPIAHVYRAAGAEIRTKCEDEQAFVLDRFLRLALEHGDDWRTAAEADLKVAHTLAEASKAAES